MHINSLHGIMICGAGLFVDRVFLYRMGVKVEDGWPCDGPLLRMAKDVASRLLPAFDTPTGKSRIGNRLLHTVF